MKRWLKIGLPLIVILLAVYWFSSRLTVSVLVEPATRGTAVNAVTGTVEVLSTYDIQVKAQSRGLIASNVVQPGSVVEAGDLLALQDSKELDLRIEQVSIRLEAARARSALESTHKIDLETLDEELEGVRLAVELKQSPQSRLDNLERNRRKTEVFWQLEEIQEQESQRLLENELSQLKLQKENMSTLAPFAGIVAEVNAFKGDLVNAGQNLVRLVSNGRYVMMELTEEDYYQVESGQPVTIRLASYPDRTFGGKASRLDDVANSNNKTRNVIVQIDAPDSVLVPGLTGEGYLVKSERDNAVLIPRRALIGNLVYVVNGGRVEVRRVQPGFLGLNKAEVIEGIEEGDLIVLEDQNLLKPGDKVKVVQPD
ncbi:MAG: efflux RND transporter periplasmic adaptor subunit [Puniceicoccaceae bacterium]